MNELTIVVHDIVWSETITPSFLFSAHKPASEIGQNAKYIIYKIGQCQKKKWIEFIISQYNSQKKKHKLTW